MKTTTGDISVGENSAVNTTVAKALVSVSDKRGIVSFCRGLADLKIEILSTGGTAQQLRENGIPVTEVSDYTEFPEIMDGRVKTLHPKIHGGILARRGTDEQTMQRHGIAPIDLVVVNLYPFVETVDNPQCTFEQALENIDIGGPTMLRAAAKNQQHTSVLVDPNDYDEVLAQLQQTPLCIIPSLRFALAAKAFEHTAAYEAAIANYLAMRLDTNEQKAACDTPNKPISLPRTLTVQFRKKQTLRYGENPHQNAAFYTAPHGHGENNANITHAHQLQGKELSFNNIADTDAALECVKQFTEKHACVIVKHANPCGVAVDETQLQAYRRAFQTDAESAFGGIIAFNRPLQAATVRAILAQQFTEVIIAPTVSTEARDAIAAKPNIRLLESGAWSESGSQFDYRAVAGGLLVQQADLALTHKLEVVSQCTPLPAQMDDLLFAWKVAKFVKSNAIVYANKQSTIGIGAGQMSRINSARIAEFKAQQAGLEVRGAVLASDAFFPFRDGIEHAAKVGVRAVIQPGGSRLDAEVIAAANEYGMVMVFTGMRHFRH